MLGDRFSFSFIFTHVRYITVARKSSIMFVQGGLTIKFYKNFTNLQCFILRFGGAGSFVWGG